MSDVKTMAEEIEKEMTPEEINNLSMFLDDEKMRKRGKHVPDRRYSLAFKSKLERIAGDRNNIRMKLVEKALEEIKGVEVEVVKADMDEVDMKIANAIVYDENKTFSEIADELEIKKDEIEMRLVHKKSLRNSIINKINDYKDFDIINKYRLEKACDLHLERMILKNMPDMSSKDQLAVIRLFKQLSKQETIGTQMVKEQTNIYINPGLAQNQALVDRVSGGA